MANGADNRINRSHASVVRHPRQILSNLLPDARCRTLEDRGYIRPQPKPFTGGAGI
jgi:hypothetical protein